MLSSLKVRAAMASGSWPLLWGAGSKAGSTDPSLWTAASLVRACPPMLLKSPPTQTDAPSLATASSLTPPPVVPAFQITPPLPSTAARPPLPPT